MVLEVFNDVFTFHYKFVEWVSDWPRLGNLACFLTLGHSKNFFDEQVYAVR